MTSAPAPSDTNALIDSKIKNLEALKAMGVEPYPHRWEVTHQAGALQEKYAGLETGVATEDIVRVAGRVMSYRNSGMFIDLHDATGKIQVFSHKDNTPAEVLARLAHFDIGDIIGVEGVIRRTPRGELTVNARDVVMLSKSVRPLPEKYHGLHDTELRYRKRYLDLIMNAESREVFRKRSEIISFIRRFLCEEGFLEVETPMMHVIPGGTTAKPFLTHHNALDMPLYMRIAPELYLKRLVVGGLEKVFEIGRNFRNEGISVKHNPEFTACEIYQAYASYTDMMALFERVVEGAVRHVNGGGTKVSYGDREIDFKAPWRRVSMVDLVREATGIDFYALDAAQAASAAAGMGIHVEKTDAWGKVVEKVFAEKVEDALVQPVHVIDIPKDVMPLAKTHPKDPRLTESFEVYINGWEIGPSFTELNDPFDQRERFMKQSEARDQGDDEAMRMDEDFLEALEYAMPPTGGIGIGIDRLVMLLTDSASIRDVIAFPTLRHK